MSDKPEKNDRRGSSDRRSRGDRRRGGEGRHVVLHLGRSMLRLGLIVRDSRGTADLLHLTALQWRHGESSFPSPEAEEELAAALKQLVVDERLAGATASLVLNSELSVNRVASGPTTEVRRTVEAIDDRSQLYLSLGPGPKTIATEIANLDARHDRAVVSVARESVIERLIEVVSGAGLDLQVIETETVALARAHGALHKDDDKPVVIALCEGGRFEITVAHRGSLLLDYRPGAGAEGESLLGLLDQHRTRIERYCQRQLSDFGLRLDVVYLAGDPEEVSHAVRELTAGGYEAKPIDTMAVRLVWDRSPESIGVNEAALLGRLLRDADAAPESPSPNLIERWIAESRKHIRPTLIRSALPLAAVLLIAVVGVIINWRVSVASSALDTQLAELQPALLEQKTLRLRMIAAQDKLLRLRSLSERVEPAGLKDLLTSVGGCLPEDVWLDRFTLTDLRSSRLSGASYSESGVYDFVRHLNSAPMFDQVALEGTGFSSTREGPATSFELKFVLADEEADEDADDPESTEEESK